MGTSVHGDDDGVQTRRPGTAMVARNPRARKSACDLKSGRCYQCADDLSAFAARISATIDWTAGDNALCLARQAGPGPRM